MVVVVVLLLLLLLLFGKAATVSQGTIWQKVVSALGTLELSRGLLCFPYEHWY